MKTGAFRACWIASLLVVSTHAFIRPNRFMGMQIHRTGWSIEHETKDNPVAMPRYPLQLMNTMPAASSLMSNQPLVPGQGSELVQNLTLARDSGDMDAFVQALHQHVKADSRPQQLSTAAHELIADVVDRISGKQLARWVWCLGKRGFKAREPRHKAILLKSMEKHSENMLSIDDFSMFLSGAATTGLQLADLPAATVDGLMKNILRMGDGVITSSISSILFDMAKLGAIWSSFSPALQALVWKVFHAASSGPVEPRNAAASVKALGDMMLDINSLNHNERQDLFHLVRFGISDKGMSFDNISKQAQICMTLLGLGKMGVQHAMLPPDSVALIEGTVLQMCANFDGRGISSCFHGLGILGFPWPQFSQSLQTALQDALLRNMGSVDPKGVQSTLLGLNKMGLSWESLPPKLRASLEGRLISLLISGQFSSNHDYFAMTINSLGHLEVKYSTFSQAFRVAVQTSCTNLMSKFGPLDLSSVLHGLGLMGASFGDFSPVFENSVGKQVQRLLNDPTLRGRAAAHILRGFADMGALWSHPSFATLEEMLAKTVASMKGGEMANCLLSLRTMEASWKDLKLNTVRAFASAFVAIAPTMDERSAANSMHGLTLLSFDALEHAIDAPYAPGSEDEEKLKHLWNMLRAVLERFSSFKPEEYSLNAHDQYSMFFDLLDVIPQGKELITGLMGGKPVWSNPVRSAAAAISVNVNDVSKALQKTLGDEFQVVNKFERLQYALIDMDLVVSRKDDGKVVAFVEVTGSGNYHMIDGKMVLKRMTALKKFICAQRFPDVPLIVFRHTGTETFDSMVDLLARKVVHGQR